MTDSMELYERMASAARRNLEAGITVDEVEAHAAEQEASGFTISAPYTRLVASLMRSIKLREES